MGGLPDINTENKAYQDYFIKFLNDCIDCGADGFRYDAAKHIGLSDDPKDPKSSKNNFWDRVTTEVHNAKSIFNYGEVLQGNGDRIEDYVKKIGACTASSYGGSLRNSIVNNNLDSFVLDDLRVGDKPNCVTWVESHDNYINDGNWAAMGDEDILTGWAVIAARAKGTPLFFDRPLGSSLEDQWGSMNRIGASGDMFYKDKRVAVLNFFRNAMVGEKEKLINPNEDTTALEICRGNKGAVIVNTSHDSDVNFKTNLADGKYIDRIDGKTEYTVSGGKLTCKKAIPEYSVVVLYNEGYNEYAPTALVKVNDKTKFTYETDTLKVKLETKNTASSTYSINDGKAVNYKNGDTVTLKAKDAKDGVVTLALSGKSSAGQSTYMKYYFKNTKITGKSSNRVLKSGDKFTLKKPSGWGDKIYAYVYDTEGTQEKEWPGKTMTKLKNGKYEYKCRFEWENAYVIFSDGNTQYPGENEQGLPLEKDKEYTID
jgi:alpha-amylase